MKKFILGFVLGLLFFSVAEAKNTQAELAYNSFLLGNQSKKYDSCLGVTDCESKIQELTTYKNYQSDAKKAAEIGAKIPNLKSKLQNYNEDIELEEIEEEAKENGEYLIEIQLKSTVLRYNEMVNAKNKNERLFEKTAQYLKDKYLAESGIKSNDTLKNIDFELDIYPEIIKQNTNKEKSIDYKAVNSDLKSLQKVFKKVTRHSVNELRSALPNGGGVLPGSKSQAGVDYAKKKLLPKLTNTLVVLALSVSTIMLIIGGIMYVTSFGEDESKTKAKNIIFYAIIGVVVAVLSYTIVKFVIGINFNIL